MQAPWLPLGSFKGWFAVWGCLFHISSSVLLVVDGILIHVHKSLDLLCIGRGLELGADPVMYCKEPLDI